MKIVDKIGQSLAYFESLSKDGKRSALIEIFTHCLISEYLWVDGNGVVRFSTTGERIGS